MPSIKERGGSTRSKFVQNVGFLANYGSKPIISGGPWSRLSIGDIVVGIPYQIVGARAVSSSDAEKARRNTPTRDTSPPGASDPQHEKRRPFCCIVKKVIKCLTIRTRDAKVAPRDVIGGRLRRHHTGNWVIRRRRGAATEGTEGRVRRAVAGLGNSE